MSEKQPKYDVFAVSGKDDNAFWLKLGAAWETKSGNGLVIQLQAHSIDGRYTLLPWKEKPPKKE